MNERMRIYFERLVNGAWEVGSLVGDEDFGRKEADRAGFQTYEDAEKYALAIVRKAGRSLRDRAEQAEGKLETQSAKAAPRKR